MVFVVFGVALVGDWCPGHSVHERDHGRSLVHSASNVKDKKYYRNPDARSLACFLFLLFFFLFFSLSFI